MKTNEIFEVIYDLLKINVLHTEQESERSCKHFAIEELVATSQNDYAKMKYFLAKIERSDFDLLFIKNLPKETERGTLATKTIEIYQHL